MTTDNSKLKTHYLQPAFLICAVLLAISASGMSSMVKRFGVYLEKEPLPLNKTLQLLDEEGLSPYRVVLKTKIENTDVLESLGTEDYIQWILEDTSVAVDSIVRRCLLFITYYDLPDQIPHVPEECYAGSGFQKLTSDSVEFEINKNGKKQKITGRYLVFGSKKADYTTLASSTKFPVFYLFNINGTYAGNRESARMALNKNIRGKSSYFCKIEWKFFNNRLGAKIYPDKEEAIRASQNLLSIVLHRLEKEHWPDTEKAKAVSAK